MPRTLTRRFATAILIAGGIALTGCANFTPGAPDTIGDGPRPGPGLFSGDDGVFTLLGDDEATAP